MGPELRVVFFVGTVVHIGATHGIALGSTAAP